MEVVDFVINYQADALQVRNELPMPRDLFVEQKMSVLQQSFIEEEKKTVLSLEKAVSLLQQELAFLSIEEKTTYEEELLLANDSIQKNFEKEDLQKAGSWQKILGFSAKMLLWIYQLGSRYLEEKKYEEAYDLFFFLTLLNASHANFFVALGLAQKGLLLNSQALASFFMASLLDAEHLVARYQIASLYVQFGALEA